TASIAQSPDKRDRRAETINAARLATIDTRIAAIDERLGSDFPDYAALVRPQPLSIDQVQAELRSDEALVLFIDTPKLKQTEEETFVWVVTKTDLRWVRSELGTAALKREVTALRCGLDRAAWSDDGAQHCADLLGLGLNNAPKNTELLPFDYLRSYQLYGSLF